MNRLSDFVTDEGPYTPEIDCNVLVNNGVRSNITKSSSDTRVDWLFDLHMKRMLESIIIPQIYHWLDPIGDWRVEATFLINLIRKYPEIRYIWLDLEQWWDNWGTWYQALTRKIQWAAVGRFSGSRISENAWNILNEVTLRVDVGVGIYSSYGFITSYAPQCSKWLGQVEFWAAHYGRQPARQTEISWDEMRKNWLPNYKILLPPGVDADKVVGHQFTGDKFKLPGMYANKEKTLLAPADVSVFDKAFLDRIGGVSVETPVPVALNEWALAVDGWARGQGYGGPAPLAV